MEINSSDKNAVSASIVKSGTDIKSALFSIKNILGDKLNITNPMFEAKELTSYALSLPRDKIIMHYNDIITDENAVMLNCVTARRLNHEPVAYIIGGWEFNSLPFILGRGVLIPREDTECAARLAGDVIKKLENDDYIPKVLDLCAGSGAIGLSLAYYHNISCTLVEKYKSAFEYLEKNSDNLKLAKKCSIVMDDIFEKNYNYQKYDIIISNPPYINKNEVNQTLDEDVYNFEPHEALFADDDGFIFYEQIAREYKKHIKPNGYIIFEIGYNGAEHVLQILKNNGYTDIKIKKDLNGNDRAVIASIS